jgi:hypothetical protein
VTLANVCRALLDARVPIFCDFAKVWQFLDHRPAPDIAIHGADPCAKIVAGKMLGIPRQAGY